MSGIEDGDDLQYLPADQDDVPLPEPRRTAMYRQVALALVVVVVLSMGLIVSSLRAQVRDLESDVDSLRAQLVTTEARLTDVRVDRYVTVPNVVGLRFREAAAILVAGGFPTSPVPDNPDRVVVRQHPEPGVRVERGAGVAVVLE